MAIVNYDREPNRLMADQSSLMLALAFSSGNEYKQLFPVIRNAICCIHKEIMSAPLSQRKSKCKAIKDGLKKQWGRYLKDGTLPKSPIIKDIPLLACSKEYAANIMASIVRWPEFYIHSEEYMNIMTSRLDEHLDMINSITYFDENGERICPYKPNIGMNESIDLNSVWTTLEIQYSSCKEFMEKTEKDMGLNVTVQDIIDSYYRLKNATFAIPHTFEEGLLRDILYIRKKIDKVAKQMRRIADGDILAAELTLSESASVIKDEKIITILKKNGWKGNTIPQVLANIFAMNYPSCELKSYEGQIELNINGEFFEPALGLGPAFKLRVVFNTHNQANNFLEPLAKLIKQSHEINDRCEDYLNQCGILNEDIDLISDVIDLDATGYSDYLARIIYLLVMDLYNIPPDIQYRIMKIFAFPIKIKDKLYYPKFGTEQGCKLVVFLMNTANRLLGYFSRDIYYHKYGKYLDGQRANVGDDVEDHIYTGTFDHKYLQTQISVFTLFNCPTNSQKCGWLSRDGVVSYCSRYFYLRDSGKGLIPCGGIPPKILGKQIINFLQFSQIFKVLNTNKIKHRPAIEVWNIMKPLLQPNMELACKNMKNIHGEFSNFKRKEELARNTDVELGGLVENQSETDLETYLNIIKYRFAMILQHNMFDAVGVFLIANVLLDENTELWKCLATVQRTSIKDVVHILEIVSTDDNIYDKDELDWCKKNISRLERAIIKGTSLSSSSSTYHRKTPIRDLDLFMDDDISVDDEFAKYYFTNADKPAMSLARFIDSFSDKSYTDIDNLKKYYYDEYLINKYDVEYYEGYCYDNYYKKVRVWDPNINKYIRIYESDSDIRNTVNGRVSNIWEIQENASKEIKDFISAYKRFYASPTYGTIYGIYDRILKRKSKRQSLTTLERMLVNKFDIARSSARKAAKEIYMQMELVKDKYI